MRTIIDLADGQLAALEAYRVQHGLRSRAEALRRIFGSLGVDDEAARPSAPVSPARPRPAPVTRPAFRSRLKGEWRAP